MVATAAIALAIRDSANGSAQENGTKVSAQFDSTGQYNVGTDSILGHDSLTVYVGWNPGIYDLRIQKTGYAQWDTSDVVVKPRPEAGESCQPVTKSITAYLRPAH